MTIFRPFLTSDRVLSELSELNCASVLCVKSEHAFIDAKKSDAVSREDQNCVLWTRKSGSQNPASPLETHRVAERAPL